MLFTVSWNVLVGVAAVTMLVVRRRQQRWRSSYQEIGGGGIKEAETDTEVSSLLSQQNSYQTL